LAFVVPVLLITIFMESSRKIKISTYILIVLGGFVLAITVAVLMYIRFTAPGPGFENAEKYFNRNKALFTEVKDFFAESKYEDVVVLSFEREGRMSNRGNSVPINNEEAERNIEKLRRRGYKTVGKTGGVVYFSSQFGFLDYAVGFAYSVGGNVPNDSSITFLTLIEPLAEDGWYYFEADYNEYRIRNRR